MFNLTNIAIICQLSFGAEHFPLVVVHKSPPVREIGDVLGAPLYGALDVKDDLVFGIVRLQGAGVMVKAAEALLPAVLANTVAATSGCVSNCFVQLSSLLDVKESSDGFHELDGAFLGDFIILELDLAEVCLVHIAQDGHQAIIADVLLDLKITGTIQCEVLKHPAVNVVFDDFHLVAAKAIVVVFPSHQLVKLGTAEDGIFHFG